MNYLLIYQFIQSHLLGIFIVTLTIFLIYHYIVDKNKIYKVSRKYKESIYQTQSKIFLNATGHLIKGDKQRAIQEFLNAVDHNKETVDTHLTLGRLFRVNGEVDKAIEIHRALLARENISEPQRLEALKELAQDFDKGGFLDKAIEAYKDVLKINPDQVDIIKSLCRIFEDLEDWDEALKYRKHLSKTSQENQSETISHIFVEQAKNLLEKGKLGQCLEKIEQALRHAPSVSAKILQLKLYIITGKVEDAKAMLIEMINEHHAFLDYMFLSLDEFNNKDESLMSKYASRLQDLKDNFLKLSTYNSVDPLQMAISKFKIFQEKGLLDDAYQYYQDSLEKGNDLGKSDLFKVEYLKFLIETGRNDEAIVFAKSFIQDFERQAAQHFCSTCGYSSDIVFWRCPQCFEWETINFKYQMT